MICKWIYFQDVVRFGRKKSVLRPFIFNKFSGSQQALYPPGAIMSHSHCYNLSACLVVNQRTYRRSGSAESATGLAPHSTILAYIVGLVKKKMNWSFPIFLTGGP